jgi:hypothetical protein
MSMMQADLFTDYDAVAADRVRRQLWFDEWDGALGAHVDCCTGVRLELPRHPGHVEPTPAVRCGRCGTVIRRVDASINHDCGYLGCPNEVDPVYSPFAAITMVDGQLLRGWRGIGQPMPVAWLAVRHDDRHFPRCEGCGCPWGLHLRGVSLPYEAGCLTYCGCKGYVSPPHSSGPTGRCPGCWGTPHDGGCPGGDG